MVDGPSNRSKPPTDQPTRQTGSTPDAAQRGHVEQKRGPTGPRDCNDSFSSEPPRDTSGSSDSTRRPPPPDARATLRPPPTQAGNGVRQPAVLQQDSVPRISGKRPDHSAVAATMPASVTEAGAAEVRIETSEGTILLTLEGTSGPPSFRDLAGALCVREGPADRFKLLVQIAGNETLAEQVGKLKGLNRTRFQAERWEQVASKPLPTPLALTMAPDDVPIGLRWPRMDQTQRSRYLGNLAARHIATRLHGHQGTLVGNVHSGAVTGRYENGQLTFPGQEAALLHLETARVFNRAIDTLRGGNPPSTVYRVLDLPSGEIEIGNRVDHHFPSSGCLHASGSVEWARRNGYRNPVVLEIALPAGGRYILGCYPMGCSRPTDAPKPIDDMQVLQEVVLGSCRLHVEQALHAAHGLRRYRASCEPMTHEDIRKAVLQSIARA